MDADSIGKMKVNDLKAELGKRGLSKQGLKAELVARLIAAVQEDSESPTVSAKSDSKKRPADNTASSPEAKKLRSPQKISVALAPTRNRPPLIKHRKGPQVAALERAGNDGRELMLSANSTEAQNVSQGYYVSQYAFGTVSVSKGKWYFEVRLEGHAQLGWASPDFTPSGDTGECWVWDTQRQQKLRNNLVDPNGYYSYGYGSSSSNSENKYGEPVNSGDVVGVGLDLEAKSLNFWLNGKDLGPAFTDIAVNPDRFLRPLIGVARRSKVKVNFGKDAFFCPPSFALGLDSLHRLLSDDELYQLDKLFDDFAGPSESPSSVLKDAALMDFQKKLCGELPDDDPAMLIIAWHLRSQRTWEITREEWLNGWSSAGVCTVGGMSKKLAEWRRELSADAALYRLFYNFVYDYLKEPGKTYLGDDEAIMAWGIIFKGRSYPMLHKFEEFLKAEKKKSVTRDSWRQLLLFFEAFPEGLASYDPNTSSWPSLFDDFAEWMKNHQ